MNQVNEWGLTRINERKAEDGKAGIRLQRNVQIPSDEAVKNRKAALNSVVPKKGQLNP